MQGNICQNEQPRNHNERTECMMNLSLLELLLMAMMRLALSQCKLICYLDKQVLDNTSKYNWHKFLSYNLDLILKDI